jgi:hypothetical protein
MYASPAKGKAWSTRCDHGHSTTVTTRLIELRISIYQLFFARNTPRRSMPELVLTKPGR